MNSHSRANKQGAAAEQRAAVTGGDKAQYVQALDNKEENKENMEEFSEPSQSSKQKDGKLIYHSAGMTNFLMCCNRV